MHFFESGANLRAFWLLHPQFELWDQGVRWDPAVQCNFMLDRDQTEAKHDGMTMLRMYSPSEVGFFLL